MTTIIRVKPTRNRKPVEPRTCCPTHANNCHFGRGHLWAGPYLLDAGKPVDGKVWSEPDSVKCANCGAICDAEVAA
jgi:hypothetical protein